MGYRFCYNNLLFIFYTKRFRIFVIFTFSQYLLFLLIYIILYFFIILLVHDSGQASRAKLIFRDSSVRPYTKEVEVKSSESLDIENGNGSAKEEEPQRGTRRKRRVSTMLLLSGGPLATTPQLNPIGLKSQDSMTAVERVNIYLTIFIIIIIMILYIFSNYIGVLL